MGESPHGPESAEVRKRRLIVEALRRAEVEAETAVADQTGTSGTTEAARDSTELSGAAPHDFGSARQAPPIPPDFFPGYEILRELQRGGQGVVYQALRKSTRQKVALKVLRDGAFANTRERIRFEREVQILGQLNHPNIVRVHDSGTVGELLFYVMDYISGQPLTQWLAQQPRPIPELLRMFATICEAVNAAHLRGVIHRDLKPSNVLIDNSGQPHVLDFGLARTILGDSSGDSTPGPMTITGQFLGSLPWASPEQAEGVPEKIDVRTDVYSLGVILYQMITGRFPYPVIGAMQDVLRNILHATPARPRGLNRAIDDELETINLKALAKERERRYQTAGELARDVRSYLAGEAIQAKRDSGWYVLRKVLRRHRLAFGVAAVLMLIVFGFGIAMTFMFQRQRELTELARLAHQRMENRTQAEQRTLTAEQFARSRRAGDIESALRLLKEAVALSPDYTRAHWALGMVHATQALNKRIGEKSALVDRALADFERAHQAAGGEPFLTAARPDPSGAPRGSPAALQSAADLLLLTRRPEAAQVLAAAEALALLTTGGASEHLSRGGGIYHLGSDPLVLPPPADTPEIARREPDWNARIRRLSRGPFTPLNPLAATGYNAAVVELLFDPLVFVDARLQLTDNPALVAGRELSADGRTWRFRLRPEARWHDGTPLTAEDFVFTFETFYARRTVFAAAEAAGPHELLFRLEAPSISALADLCHLRPLPRHVYTAWLARQPDATARDFYAEYSRNPAVANGPYRLRDAPTAEQVELLRWEEYPGRRPWLAGVVFQHVPDSGRRCELLASENVDECELSADEFRWLINGESFAERIAKITAPMGQYDFIAWNLADETRPFADAGVRRALALAVDLENLRENLFGGLYQPFGGIFAATSWAGDLPQRLGYDPREAARLLEAAGWRLGDDGVRARDGAPLAFTLLVPQESTGAASAALVLGQEWAAVGVRMTIERHPFAVIQARSRSGVFDAFLGGAVSGLNPIDGRIRWITNGEFNFGRYRNDEVEHLFERVRRVTDPRQEAALLRRIQKLIYDDQPYLFLWHKPAMLAISRRLRGVELSPLGIRFHPGPRAWWVSSGE